MKPINGEIFNTGGHCYVGIGQTDDGNWYIADFTNDDVRVVDANPNESPNDGEDAWYPEWQEAHLVKDFENWSKEAILFLADVAKICAPQSTLADGYKREYPQYFDEPYTRFYVHAYNQVKECNSPLQLYSCIRKIFLNTNEYKATECDAIANMISNWGELVMCPGTDSMNFNGMVITTETIYSKNIVCKRSK